MSARDGRKSVDARDKSSEASTASHSDAAIKLQSAAYAAPAFMQSQIYRMAFAGDTSKSLQSMGFPRTHISTADAKEQPAKTDDKRTGEVESQGNPDFREKGGPAAIRYNNPGAMYPGESARKFGSTETRTIAGHNKIAVFKDAVHGAAAQFDLLGSRKYEHMSLRHALSKWTGHRDIHGYLSLLKAEGINANARVGDLIKDKDKAISLAKCMARFEAGRDYPLSTEQWGKAYELYSGHHHNHQEHSGRHDHSGSPENPVTPKPPQKSENPVTPEPPDGKPDGKGNDASHSGGDRNSEVPKPGDEPASSKEKAQITELHLEHGSGQRGSPDAIVRLPQNFDPSKPINLTIYNHGFYDSAKSAFKHADLDEQMRNAPPNTVLVVPEWQRNPAAASGNQGSFQNPGQFKGMLQEIFSRTPGLKGKSLDDVANINIIAHSAGYGPSETELYKNGLESKVKSVTLLDALYDGHGFDHWLQDNIKDLSDGKKQFNNIYYGTSKNSLAQADRIKEMLRRGGLSSDAMVVDTSSPDSVMSPDELANHSIVFKHSTATEKGKGPHMSLPNLYFGLVEDKPL